MSLSSIGRSFQNDSKTVICLPGPCNLSAPSKSALCRIIPFSRGFAFLSFPLTVLLNTSVRSSGGSRGLRTYASFANSGRKKTSWDEAAESYFADEKEAPAPKKVESNRAAAYDEKQRNFRGGATDSGSSNSWERNEERLRKASTTGTRNEGATWKEEGTRDLPTGVKKWKSSANRERQDFGRNSGGREGYGRGRATQYQISEPLERESSRYGEKRSGYGGEKSSANRERQDFGRNSRGREGYGSGRATQYQNSEPLERESSSRYGEKKSGYGGERGQWQKPATAYRPSREAGPYNGRSGIESSWSKNYNNRRQDDMMDFGDNNRRYYEPREYSPPLQVEGQPLYGVAPILSALQVSRRTFYCLYLQENLMVNLGIGRRKDKAAVLAIENMAKSMGVTVKEASKHDLNMLVDNRPHQGLILDASPLELTPVNTLEAPIYDDCKPPPVWVALDEVTDPQNFGAILRSAFFLGAEGVVVCAKNSAPLSGVVSKASAGALEVMEVLYCKNMVRFLEKCKEDGWRVVGASAEHTAVPVRELPHGIATVLVLGSEGKGLRTNVKRSCNELVSIAGTSKSYRPPKQDFAIDEYEAQEFEDEDMDLEEDEDEEDGLRRGAELGSTSRPSAVDSLNVSVAAGIMLYELLDRPVEKDI